MRQFLLNSCEHIAIRGVHGADEVKGRKLIEAAAQVFDVVAMPAETPLIRAAREAGKPVITGAEVIALQALEQFVLYTGVRPSPPQIEAAAAVALAP